MKKHFYNLATFALSSFVALSACSNDSTDVASVVDDALAGVQEGDVSFEGESYFLMDKAQIRFVGAHTAYANLYMLNDVSDYEALCEYSATKDTLVLQVKKIPATAGGELLTEEEFIFFWNSDDWRREYIGYSRGSWAADGFEIESTTVKTEASKSGDESSVTISTSAEYRDSVVFWNPDEEDSVVINDTIQFAESFTAVIKNVKVENGKKTTTTVTRKYSEEVASRAMEFYNQYKMLSDNDWKIIHNAFLPFKFSYKRDGVVSETQLFDDDGKRVEIKMPYDLELTQHYTEVGNATFYGKATDSSDFMFTYLSLSTGTINVGDDLIYRYVGSDMKKQAFTFEEFKVVGSDEDREEESSGTIAAKYTVHENGDSTKIELSFETKKGFYVSGKTIECQYVPLTLPMKKE